jgi:exodeoxyribonuclease VII small subunit
MAKRKHKDDFESRLKRLQEVVEALEQGDLPLEEGVALYKEGLTLARACREQLQQARNDISVFSEGILKEFEEAPPLIADAGDDDGRG